MHTMKNRFSIENRYVDVIVWRLIENKNQLSLKKLKRMNELKKKKKKMKEFRIHSNVFVVGYLNCSNYQLHQTSAPISANVILHERI